MLASSQSNKPWSVVMSMSRSRGLINEAMALPFPCSGRLLTGAALFFSRARRSASSPFRADQDAAADHEDGDPYDS